MDEKTSRSQSERDTPRLYLGALGAHAVKNYQDFHRHHKLLESEEGSISFVDRPLNVKLNPSEPATAAPLPQVEPQPQQAPPVNVADTLPEDLETPLTEVIDQPQLQNQPQPVTIYGRSHSFAGMGSKRRIVAVALIGVLLLLLLTGLLVWVFAHQKAPTANNQAVTSVPNEDLQSAIEKGLEGRNQITINGPVLAKGGFAINPSSRPDNPQAGQIYFDSQTGQFFYFDGQIFQTIATNLTIDQLTALSRASAGTGVSLVNNTLINTGVLSLQGQTGNITFNGGNGISVNGTQISNTGIISVTGTANQVSVSLVGGVASLSLPQDIAPNSSPTFSNLTLNNALGISSGGTGSGLSSFAANGAVYFDGVKLVSTPTAGAPGLCLVSTAGAPTFGSCGGSGTIGGSGTAGFLPIFQTSTSLTDSILSQALGTITVNGQLSVTGASTFTGLANFNGGLTVEAGDTLTVNGDGFTDLTGNGLQVSVGALTLALQANKGLEVDANGLSLIDCLSGEILKYNGSNQWVCATDAGASGLGDDVYVNGTPATNADFRDVAGTGTATGTSWSLNAVNPDQITLSIDNASATTAGAVTTGAQTFAGAKTFNGQIIAGGGVNLGTQTLQGTTAVIDFSNFDVSSAGAVTAVGVNAGSGLLQGTGGLSVGGTITLSSLTNGFLEVDGTGVVSVGTIDLGTDTNGNYVATVTAGNGISGSSAIEGGTPTIALSNLTSDWLQSGAFDIVLDNSASELKIREAAGSFYAILDVADLLADQTFTLNEGGTVVTSGNASTHATTGVTAGNGLTGGGGVGALTLDIGAGNGITVNANDITLALHATSPGLQVDGNGLSLIRTCSSSEILKWNGSGWACAVDDNGSGGGYVTGSGTQNTLSKFDVSGTNLVDSTITDNGSTVTTSANLAVQGGALELGQSSLANSSILFRNSTNANTVTLQSGATGVSYSLILPTGAGAQYQCLKYDTGGQLIWDNCDGGSGGGSGVTLLNTFTGSVSIQGTTNQVNVNNSGNTITLSTPQDINTGATPTFAGLTLNGNLSVGANSIVTSLTTIGAAELDRLDGKDAPLVDTNDAVNTALTGTGALTSGSIALGFGSIDVGANAISTTGTVTAGTVSINAESFTDLTGFGLQNSTGVLTLALQASKGLEVDGNGLSLIDCANGEILKYNGSNQWACAADAGASGLGDDVYVNGTPATNADFRNTIGTGTSTGTTWSLSALNPDQITVAIDNASATTAGAVTTGAQTFAGAKTFNGQVIAGAGVNLGTQTLQGTTAVIDFNNFDVSSAGAVTAVGVNAGSGLLQGMGGLTVAGTVTLSSLTNGFLEVDGSGVVSVGTIDLGTDTTGNYVATITAGNGISGTSNTEGGTPTIALSNLTSDWLQSGAFDIVLDNANSELKIRGSGGAFYAIFDAAALTSDQTFTLNEGGTVVTSGNVSSYTTTGVTAGNGLTGGGTTGVLTLDIGAGNGVTVNANDITLALQANKGLEVDANGLSLIDCLSGEILKYNGSNQWVCATDAGASGLGDDIYVNSVAATNANFLDVAGSGTSTATTWSLNAVSNPDDITLTIGNASATEAGAVTTGVQTFAGAKTFNGQIVAGAGIDLGAQTLQGTTAIINFTNFDVDASGNITVGTINTATISGGSLSATQVNSLNVGANAISTTSGNLTIDANTTGQVSIGGISTGDILFGGGVASTGCTVENASGNLSCTGDITGAAAGTVGYWSRGGTILQPATAGDSIQTSGDIGTTGTGIITAAGILNANATGKTAITIADSGAQNSGLTIGSDTNLYRSAANALKTDDSFTVGGTSSTNSVNMFQIQDASGTTVLNSDTTNGRLTVRGTNIDAIAGSNLITITDFTNPVWTTTGWTPTVANATHNTGNTSAISTNQFAVTAGTLYRVNFVVTGNTNPGETLTLQIGGTNYAPVAGTATTSYATEVMASNTNDLQFIPTSNWNGTISNVQVRAISGGVSDVFHVTDGTAINSSLYNINDTAIFSRSECGATCLNNTSGINLIVADNDNAGSRGVFKATRSRGTTSSPTAVLQGDTVMSLVGAAFDGVTTQSSAVISSIVDGVVSPGVAPQRIGIFTSATDAASRVERLTVSSNGNIGIGVTSPTISKLQLAADTAAAGGITFGTDTNLYRSAADTLKTDDAFVIGGTTGSNSATKLQVQNTAGTSILTVDTANGRLGINTAPSYALDVSGNRSIVGPSSATYRGANITGTLSVDDTYTGDAALLNAQLSFNDIGGSNASPIAAQRVEISSSNASPFTTLQGQRIVVSSTSPNDPTLIGSDISLTGNANDIAYGVKLAVVSSGAPLSTGYGLYVGDIGATTGYGIYQAGANDLNYLAGSLTVGTLGSGGTTILCSNAGQVSTCAPGTGSGSFILNDTALQTANFNIQGSANAFSTAKIAQVSGQTGAALQLVTATSSDALLWGIVSGDTNSRISIDGNGVINWGPGNASADTNLYRAASNTLQTDDSLIVGGTGGANSTAKFQVQSTAGTEVLTTDTTNSQLTVRGIASDASLGSELASGTTCTGSNWTGAGPWAHASSGSPDTLTCTVPASVTAGATYQVTFDVSGSPTAGTYIWPIIGATAGGQVHGNVTTVTILVTASNTTGLSFSMSQGTWNGTIANISVKQVTLTNSVLNVKNSSGVTSLEIRASGTISNTFIGLQAGRSNTSGTSNTALGYSALQSNTDGSGNTAIGNFALRTNTTGLSNTALGNGALGNNLSGSLNTAIGGASLQLNSNGSNNVAIGGGAMLSNVTGGQNTSIGLYAGRSNTTGSNNTYLGYQAGYRDPNVTAFNTLGDLQNAAAIGYGAQVQQSNSLVLGGIGSVASNLTPNVGIGTTSPTNLFSISPNIYDTGTASTTASATVVGVGTTWTANMVGMEFVFANGNKYTIVGFTDATHLTLSSSSTNSSQAYRIHNPAFYVSSTGSAGFRTSTNSTTAFQIQNASSTSLFTVDTTNSVVKVGAATTSITPALAVTTAEVNTRILVGTTTDGVDINTGAGANNYFRLKGNARNQKKIKLTAEYSGLVLDADGSNNTGTVTSAFDGVQRESYYNWTTTQASNQDYDFVVQIPLPSDYSSSAGAYPSITIDRWTSDTTNGTITAQLLDTSGATVTNWNTCAQTPGSANTWTTTAGCAISSGTFAADGVITLRIKLQAPQNGNTRIGNITLTYLSEF